MKWYIKVLSNYANFKGRARRKEYWMFVLFNFLIGIVIGMIDNVLGIENLQLAGFKVGTTYTFGGTTYSTGLLRSLYDLFVFLPGLAVLVRRLHDTNKSGKLLLIYLIPIALIFITALIKVAVLPLMILSVMILIIFSILIFVFTVIGGDEEVNDYGPNPKTDKFDADLLDI